MHLMEDIDKDGNHTLSKSEYDEACESNENIKDKFGILQVDPSEYEEIWKLLDDTSAGDGEVEIMMFAHCLRDLKGGAKAKDSFSILRKVHQLNIRLQRLVETLNVRHHFAEELRNEAMDVRKQLGSLQHDMCEFARLVGCCIPTAGVKVKPGEIDNHMKTLQEKVEEYM